MVIIDDKVYFDTDCLSGFLTEKEMGSLFMLFKNNIVIPDAVYRELVNYPPFKAEIEQYVKNKAITVVDIEFGSEESKIYFQIIKEPHIKKFGDGEAEVISFAICNSKKMASNNLSDVASYVEHYNLINYTISDIIDMLVKNGIKTQDEADQLYVSMKKNGRLLPFNTYTEYLESKAS